MPANTLSDMILGFSVVIGILFLYVLSLFLRLKHEKRKASLKNRQKKA